VEKGVRKAVDLLAIGLFTVDFVSADNAEALSKRLRKLQDCFAEARVYERGLESTRADS